MTVSIVIAVKTWQNNLEECINRCLELDYPDFEIIVLPDEKQDLSANLTDHAPKGAVPIKVIPTGPVSPAHKRDLALEYAKGETLAFIDDDAYPQKDWLKNAVRNFTDPDVAAVGGPAITPPNDGFMQKASGAVYASPLVSSKYIYRYLPKRRMEVDDYPSCNFLVRKSVMKELGGFNTAFWPGEDTKLCLDITKRLGKKIVYEPEAVVWHHRRPLFLPHLRQIANYALHRGYFARRYPQTSLRAVYFIPSLFLAVLICAGSLSLFLPPIRFIYILGISLYFILVLIVSVFKGLKLFPFVFFGTVLSHFAYGFYFIIGLLSKKLKEEKQ